MKTVIALKKSGKFKNSAHVHQSTFAFMAISVQVHLSMGPRNCIFRWT